MQYQPSEFLSSSLHMTSHPHAMLRFYSFRNIISSDHLLVSILSLALLALVPAAEAIYKLPKNVTIPAIIVFGDSIVDTGNNNKLPTIFKANFLPYGEHFKGGISTGRYCDGKVPSDLIAEELGIKEVVPAYFDSGLKPHDLITGVSFASGGTGYDPLTSEIIAVMSLSQQLECFKEYKERLKGIVGENRTNFILANSLVLVVASSNDIANTYFTLSTRRFHYDIPSYTDLLLHSASSFVKEIYGLGMRRIGVLSAPPIGCLPSQRTMAGGRERECAGDHNEAAISFNTKLSVELDSLNKKLPGSKVVYIDVYKPFQDIVDRPQKYGFEVANKGCCGTGEIEVSVLCNPMSPTCEDASKYVFWDSFHPTEKTYKIIVSHLLKKYIHKLF